MARVGMANLIAKLRAMTNTGTADYAVAGVTYWTDDQLQEALDAHRCDVYREPLTAQATYDDTGVARYYDYYTGHRNLEEAGSGDNAWQIETTRGSAVPASAYTVNYSAGHIRFTNDQAGTAYYLNARSYDLARSAAEIWLWKAAHIAMRYDVQTDNHHLSRSQEYKAYVEMSNYYRKKASPKFVTLKRKDYGNG